MAARRESDFQRLEERLRELERRREEAEQRREEAEQRLRATTFDEYLEACHVHISKRLSIQVNKSITTTGALTSVTGKVCPSKLRPWEGFNGAQASLLIDARKRFHSDCTPHLRRFATVQHLQELGADLCDRKYASESDLASYERLAVEGPTAKIMEQLSKMTELDGLGFDNHANALNDQGEEALEHDMMEDLQNPRIQGNADTRHPSEARKRGRPDQYCIYKTAGSHKLLLVAEYKAAHKLSVQDLQTRLRPMNLANDVINVSIFATEQEQKDHKADWRIGCAITQAYSYMIENGLEYSYITTGVALVFLWVRAKNPATVYYHLAIPNEDVDRNGYDWQRTAVAQVLGLCLMAFQSEQFTERNQGWRNKMMDELERWEKNAGFSSQSDEDRERVETPSSLFKANGGLKISKNSDRTPIKLRLRGRKRCEPPKIDPAPEESSSDLSETESSMKNPKIGQVRQLSNRSNEEERQSLCKDQDKGKHQRQRYCSQKCLLGIRQKSTLDERCPNVSKHRRMSDRHTISLPEFTALVNRQLDRTLDRNCEPLGQRGARGALFRIRLTSHGYVFVAKGTIRAFVSNLRHEGRVYRHLEHLQGAAVPVYLGNIDLAKPYHLDVEVRIVHMLLMSWGGDVAESYETVKTRPSFQAELRRTVAEVTLAGINQADLRPPNVLWNRELDRLMLIDFERAMFLNRDRRCPRRGFDFRAMIDEDNDNGTLRDILSPANARLE